MSNLALYFVVIYAMQARSVINSKPFFIIFLPVFFVLHGFVEHYDFIGIKDALLLVSFYLAGSVLMTAFCRIIFHDLARSGLVAFCLVAFFFFFGAIQDFLREYFAGTYFARYSFILPLALVIFACLGTWIKRRSTPPKRCMAYLNVFVLLLIVIDLAWLAEKIISSGKKRPFTLSNLNLSVCDSCQRPDIFFIILDEYSGNEALKEFFGFDNTGFETQLKQRGFYIAHDSRSNYNYTPFSVASILTMDYLALDMEKKAPGNIDYCYRQIKNSTVLAFLQANGYRFYNYSIFDFKDRPAVNYDNFLPNSTALITSQTLFSRVMKDISYNISTGKWKLNLGLKKRTYQHLHNNRNVLQGTEEIVSKGHHGPKFVYAHLMMPHYPYYFNSRGEALPIEQLMPAQEFNKENYIEYLQYCNGQILGLVDTILTSKKPPVIMLLGDHGFRQTIKANDHKYAFMNLNAIFLPDKSYDRFYDSISNVNQFRVLFNTEFGQHLPLLKDSTIFLWESRKN